LVSQLKKILSDDSNNLRFYDIIRKVLPDFQGEFSLKDVEHPAGGRSESTTLMYKDKSDSRAHTAGLAGDGILSLAIIASNIILSKINKKILVIDEPELHLHPSAQKRLTKLLSTEARERQIIIITHSPYFICWEQLANGAKLFKLNKHDSEGCTIHEWKHDSFQQIIGCDNPLRYHLFDITAKEIMFTDKILFVEGQEDAGILYHYYAEKEIEPSFNIFGYGVNGWGNFHIFLKISKELGIKKIAVLYDKSKENDQDPKRGGITLDEDLKQNKKQYKDYYFCQLKTEDIRDKKDKDNGTFDINGKLKETHHVDFDK
jgi:predicted ATP-dependent endonuclease of OLD family